MDDAKILDLIDQALHSEADAEEITTFVIAALGLRMGVTT